MQHPHKLPIHTNFARTLLLSAAFIVGISGLPVTSADAQPLTKEQIEEMKRKQQQRAQPQQPQQPQRQVPPPNANRQGPSGDSSQRQQRQIQQRQVTPPPPPQQPRIVTPPPPPAPKIVTPPPPLAPKVVTPPPPVVPKIVTPPPPVQPRIVTPSTTPPPPSTLPQGRGERRLDPKPDPKVGAPSLPPPDSQGQRGRQFEQRQPSPNVGAPILPPPSGGTPPTTARGGNQPPAIIPPSAVQGTAPPSILRQTTRPVGVTPSGQILKPGTANVGRRVAPVTQQTNISQFQGSRVVSTDTRGRQVIQEAGNRTIIRQGNVRVIHRSETGHIKHYYPGARTTPLPNGILQTSYVRPDGVRIFTETDRSGRIIRRFGRGGGGRDIVYIDNRRFYRNLAIGAGIAAVGVGVALALAPPAIAMPRERYIIDYDRASDDDLYEALSAPPVERLERGYSLEEIRYNDTLRARMRRIDVDTVTFETGSFEVTEEQYPKLERIARAIARVIERDPAETFLIEGHTDAVGNEEDNLSLSDRRAESVAQVLTDYYSIPLENIVTQGYGEQHLKVDSQGPERLNRRVTLRRITPLMSKAD